MKGRRSFLQLLTGGLAAASTTRVTLGDIARDTGIATDITPASIVAARARRIPRRHASISDLIRELDLYEETTAHEGNEVPPHIATKKSWSPAFKNMVLCHEIRLREAYRETIRKDRALAEKMAKLMGVPLEWPEDDDDD